MLGGISKIQQVHNRVHDVFEQEAYLQDNYDEEESSAAASELEIKVDLKISAEKHITPKKIQNSRQSKLYLREHQYHHFVAVTAQGELLSEKDTQFLFNALLPPDDWMNYINSFGHNTSGAIILGWWQNSQYLKDHRLPYINCVRALQALSYMMENDQLEVIQRVIQQEPFQKNNTFLVSAYIPLLNENDLILRRTAAIALSYLLPKYHASLERLNDSLLEMLMFTPKLNTGTSFAFSVFEVEDMDSLLLFINKDKSLNVALKNKITALKKDSIYTINENGKYQFLLEPFNSADIAILKSFLEKNQEEGIKLSGKLVSDSDYFDNAFKEKKEMDVLGVRIRAAKSLQRLVINHYPISDQIFLFSLNFIESVETKQNIYLGDYPIQNNAPKHEDDDWSGWLTKQSTWLSSYETKALQKKLFTTREFSCLYEYIIEKNDIHCLKALFYAVCANGLYAPHGKDKITLKAVIESCSKMMLVGTTYSFEQKLMAASLLVVLHCVELEQFQQGINYILHRFNRKGDIDPMVQSHCQIVLAYAFNRDADRTKQYTVSIDEKFDDLRVDILRFLTQYIYHQENAHRLGPLNQSRLETLVNNPDPIVSSTALECLNYLLHKRQGHYDHNILTSLIQNIRNKKTRRGAIDAIVVMVNSQNNLSHEILIALCDALLEQDLTQEAIEIRSKIISIMAKLFEHAVYFDAPFPADFLSEAIMQRLISMVHEEHEDKTVSLLLKLLSRYALKNVSFKINLDTLVQHLNMLAQIPSDETYHSFIKENIVKVIAHLVSARIKHKFDLAMNIPHLMDNLLNILRTGHFVISTVRILKLLVEESNVYPFSLALFDELIVQLTEGRVIEDRHKVARNIRLLFVEYIVYRETEKLPPACVLQLCRLLPTEQNFLYIKSILRYLIIQERASIHADTISALLESASVDREDVSVFSCELLFYSVSSINIDVLNDIKMTLNDLYEKGMIKAPVILLRTIIAVIMHRQEHAFMDDALIAIIGQMMSQSVLSPQEREEIYECLTVHSIQVNESIIDVAIKDISSSDIAALAGISFLGKMLLNLTDDNKEKLQEKMMTCFVQSIYRQSLTTPILNALLLGLQHQPALGAIIPEEIMKFCLSLQYKLNDDQSDGEIALKIIAILAPIQLSLKESLKQLLDVTIQMENEAKKCLEQLSSNIDAGNKFLKYIQAHAAKGKQISLAATDCLVECFSRLLTPETETLIITIFMRIAENGQMILPKIQDKFIQYLSQKKQMAILIKTINYNMNDGYVLPENLFNAIQEVLRKRDPSLWTCILEILKKQAIRGKTVQPRVLVKLAQIIGHVDSDQEQKVLATFVLSCYTAEGDNIPLYEKEIEVTKQAILTMMTSSQSDFQRLVQILRKLVPDFAEKIADYFLFKEKAILVLRGSSNKISLLSEIVLLLAKLQSLASLPDVNVKQAIKADVIKTIEHIISGETLSLAENEMLQMLIQCSTLYPDYMPSERIVQKLYLYALYCSSSHSFNHWLAWIECVCKNALNYTVPFLNVLKTIIRITEDENVIQAALNLFKKINNVLRKDLTDKEDIDLIAAIKQKNGYDEKQLMDLLHHKYCMEGVKQAIVFFSKGMLLSQEIVQRLNHLIQTERIDTKTLLDLYYYASTTNNSCPLVAIPSQRFDAMIDYFNRYSSDFIFYHKFLSVIRRFSLSEEQKKKLNLQEAVTRIQNTFVRAQLCVYAKKGDTFLLKNNFSKQLFEDKIQSIQQKSCQQADLSRIKNIYPRVLFLYDTLLTHYAADKDNLETSFNAFFKSYIAESRFFTSMYHIFTALMHCIEIYHLEADEVIELLHYMTISKADCFVQLNTIADSKKQFFLCIKKQWLCSKLRDVSENKISTIHEYYQTHLDFIVSMADNMAINLYALENCLKTAWNQHDFTSLVNLFKLFESADSAQEEYQDYHWKIIVLINNSIQQYADISTITDLLHLCEAYIILHQWDDLDEKDMYLIQVILTLLNQGWSYGVLINIGKPVLPDNRLSFFKAVLRYQLPPEEGKSMSQITASSEQYDTIIQRLHALFVKRHFSMEAQEKSLAELMDEFRSQIGDDNKMTEIRSVIEKVCHNSADSTIFREISHQPINEWTENEFRKWAIDIKNYTLTDILIILNNAVKLYTSWQETKVCSLHLMSEHDKNKLKPNKLYLTIEDDKIKYRTHLTPGEHLVLLEEDTVLQYTELHHAISEDDLSSISQLCKNSLFDVASKRGHTQTKSKNYSRALGFGLRQAQLLVIYTLLNNSCNLLSQLLTGEGKSLVIAVIALIKILQGETVDIVVSSALYAERDSAEVKNFLAIFGKTSSHNNSSMEHDHAKTLNPCYKADIVYGEISQFQFDILRHEFKQYGTRGARKTGCIIVDEADINMLDKATDVAKLSEPIPAFDHLEFIFVMIWARLRRALNGYDIVLASPPEKELLPETVYLYQNDVGQLLYSIKQISGEELRDRLFVHADLATVIHKKIENGEKHIHHETTKNQELLKNAILKQIMNDENYEYAKAFVYPFNVEALKENITQYISKILETKIEGAEINTHLNGEKILLPMHLQTYIATQKETWINSAIHVFFNVERERDYVIKPDDNGVNCIVPVDHAQTGMTLLNTQWSDGVHQFLQLKEGLKLTSETLTTNYLSNYAFFKRYHQIIGLTGTIGNQKTQAFLSKMYTQGPDLLFIPRDCSANEKTLTFGYILTFEKETWVLSYRDKTKNSVIPLEITSEKKEDFDQFLEKFTSIKIPTIMRLSGDDVNTIELLTGQSLHEPDNTPLKCLLFPSHKHKRLFSYQPQIMQGKEYWIEQIKESVAHEIQVGRAVLVHCKNIRDFDYIYKALIKHNPAYKIIQLRRSDVNTCETGNIILDEQCIFMTTNLGARAIDLKLSSHVNKNGGLHVIASSFATYQRVFEQVIGRTARSGNPGTSELIINTEDLAEDLNIDCTHHIPSVSELEAYRDKLEEENLNGLESILYRILWRDNLFLAFCQLLKKITKSLESQHNIHYAHLDWAYAKLFVIEKEAKLSALKERWGLWSKQLKPDLDKKGILDEFDAFRTQILDDYEQGQLIKNPCYFLQQNNRILHYANSWEHTLAQCGSYRDIFHDAIIKNCEQVSDPQFQAQAYAMKAYAVLTQNKEDANGQAVAYFKEAVNHIQNYVAPQLLLQQHWLRQVDPHLTSKQNSPCDFSNQISEKLSAISLYAETYQKNVMQIERAKKLVDLIIDNNPAHEKQTQQACLEKLQAVSEKANIVLTFYHLRMAYDLHLLVRKEPLQLLELLNGYQLINEENHHKMIFSSCKPEFYGDLLNKIANSQIDNFCMVICRENDDKTVTTKEVIGKKALSAELKEKMTILSITIPITHYATAVKLVELLYLEIAEASIEVHGAKKAQAIELLQKLTLEEESFEKIYLRPIETVFANPKHRHDIHQLAANGFHFFFELRERQPLKKYTMMVIGVVVLGEVVVGSLLVVFAAPSIFGVGIGIGLIADGITDGFELIKIGVTREHNWQHYAIQKAVSLGLIVITAGISSTVAASTVVKTKSGVSTGKTATKLTASKVMLADMADDSVTNVIIGTKMSAKVLTHKGVAAGNFATQEAVKAAIKTTAECTVRMAVDQLGAAFMPHVYSTFENRILTNAEYMVDRIILKEWMSIRQIFACAEFMGMTQFEFRFRREVRELIKKNLKDQFIALLGGVDAIQLLQQSFLQESMSQFVLVVSDYIYDQSQKITKEIIIQYLKKKNFQPDEIKEHTAALIKILADSNIIHCDSLLIHKRLPEQKIEWSKFPTYEIYSAEITAIYHELHGIIYGKNLVDNLLNKKHKNVSLSVKKVMDILYEVMVNATVEETVAAINLLETGVKALINLLPGLAFTPSKLEHPKSLSNPKVWEFAIRAIATQSVEFMGNKLEPQDHHKWAQRRNAFRFSSARSQRINHRGMQELASVREQFYEYATSEQEAHMLQCLGISLAEIDQKLRESSNFVLTDGLASFFAWLRMDDAEIQALQMYFDFTQILTSMLLWRRLVDDLLVTLLTILWNGLNFFQFLTNTSAMNNTPIDSMTRILDLILYEPFWDRLVEHADQIPLLRHQLKSKTQFLMFSAYTVDLEKSLALPEALIDDFMTLIRDCLKIPLCIAHIKNMLDYRNNTSMKLHSLFDLLSTPINTANGAVLLGKVITTFVDQRMVTLYRYVIEECQVTLDQNILSMTGFNDYAAFLAYLGLKVYDLALMSSLLTENGNIDKDKAQKGTIHLSNDGKYILRDFNEIVQEGNFEPTIIPKSGLEQNLKNFKFLNAILETALKAGHIQSKEINENDTKILSLCNILVSLLDPHDSPEQYHRLKEVIDVYGQNTAIMIPILGARLFYENKSFHEALKRHSATVGDVIVHLKAESVLALLPVHDILATIKYNDLFYGLHNIVVISKKPSILSLNHLLTLGTSSLKIAHQLANNYTINCAIMVMAIFLGCLCYPRGGIGQKVVLSVFVGLLLTFIDILACDSKHSPKSVYPSKDLVPVPPSPPVRHYSEKNRHMHFSLPGKGKREIIEMTAERINALFAVSS